MTRSGYIAIIGQPNVGKSTLLNQILGKKLSITSKKPQTTRHQILGIKTQDEVQYIFVDTPGVHRQERHSLNHYMNRAAMQSLKDVDVICFVVAGTKLDETDQWLLNKLSSIKTPKILVINKLDKIKDRQALLPLIKEVSEQYDFNAYIPISALNGEQVPELLQTIEPFLPENPHFFPADSITDRSDRFVATEMIREKLTRFLGQELPYSVTVTIDAFEDSEKLLRLAAVIWVGRDSHKKIVIGDKGEGLKLIGTEARKALEHFFNKKVYLNLWVKVKENWYDNKHQLHKFGYDE